MIKKQELKQMNPERLDSTLVELKKDLMKLRSQLSTGSSVEKPSRIKQIKKNIARINTYKNQLNLKKSDSKKSKINREEKTKPQ
ncbi:MAG: 50S ribosomal protein L29 [archaeon]